ncbi:MAG: hypothetical protein KIT84_42040 [Labilithrix sp.]|nr:hypothetical protein [Labilithrix sp.]MCW5817656.1 hypothetical protein [Labilithrix sp.]
MALAERRRGGRALAERRAGWGLAVLAAALILFSSGAAHAQKWVTSGVTQFSSGIEGGGGRVATMGRAQTRARIGADLFVDEDPQDIFGAAVIVAVEPRSAFGLDFRYTRVVAQRFAFSGGAIGILQPASLVGPVAAAEYRIPLGKGFVFTAGPEANVFVVGTDLPDRTVIWQGLFLVGMRVSL